MSVRRRVVWLVGAAVVAGGVALALVPGAQVPSKLPADFRAHSRPLVFAHRGGAGEGPEATIPTMQAVIERDPQVGIELDVRQTRDGHIVVIHDATVDRTTNGTGAVADLTLADLRGLDAAHCAINGGGTARPPVCRDPAQASSFGLRNHGYRIPTLAEVLDTVPPTTVIAIEVKEAGFEAPLATLLRQSGRGGRLIVGSGRDGVAARLRELLPPGFAGLYFPKWAALRLVAGTRLTSGRLSWPDHQVFAAPMRAAGVSLSSRRFIANLHRQGLWAVYFIINDEADMNALFAQGADAIITDFPGRAAQMRDRRRSAGAGAAVP